MSDDTERVDAYAAGRRAGEMTAREILTYAERGYTDFHQTFAGVMPSFRPSTLKQRREWLAGFRRGIKNALGEKDST